MVSFDRLDKKSLPLIMIIKYKMAANHGRWIRLEQMVVTLLIILEQLMLT